MKCVISEDSTIRDWIHPSMRIWRTANIPVLQEYSIRYLIHRLTSSFLLQKKLIYMRNIPRIVLYNAITQTNITQEISEFGILGCYISSHYQIFSHHIFLSRRVTELMSLIYSLCPLCLIDKFFFSQSHRAKEFLHIA